MNRRKHLKKKLKEAKDLIDIINKQEQKVKDLEEKYYKK